MNKIELINHTFDVISKVTNDNFVTIRNFHHIPEKSSIENDIDVLVPSEYINSLTEKLSKVNYRVQIDNLRYLYGAEPHIHYMTNDVHFDIVTGLYYRSSNDLNTFVSANIELNESMMGSKVKVDGVWKYQPSAEDELVHLCCHAIFDKRLVKESYAKRIDYLFKDCDEEKVKWLLDKAFYKVSGTIFKNIKNNKKTEIYNSYISFIDY